MTSRKQPGVMFWISVALVAVIVAYPLSFGPAVWVCSQSPETSGWWEVVDTFYSPILRAWFDGPGPVIGVIRWYANLGAPASLTVARMLDGSYCVIRDYGSFSIPNPFDDR